MANEPVEFWAYRDPPLASGPDRLRAYIEDMRSIEVPTGHPQADDIRADIALAEQRLTEIEQEGRSRAAETA